MFATDVATFAEVTAFACIAFVSTALSASSDSATASAAMSAAVIVSVAIYDSLICDIAINFLYYSSGLSSGVFPTSTHAR